MNLNFKAKYLAISLLKRAGLYEWQRRFRSIPLSIRVCNFLAQRILRLNAQCKWSVHFTSRVIHGQKIQLSDSAALFMALSGGCYFNGQSGIRIGDGTIFAPGVKVVSANHDLCDYTIHSKDVPVRIGSNCWLGAGCIVLPGVQLGDHVVVAAGSVVTKSFGPNVLVGGVPARVLKELPSYRHLRD
jgi:acetyltransferase-like isoleucine patch superfamily enzyme